VPPPDGTAWYVVTEDSKGVVIYAKKIDPRHSFVATVMTIFVSDCCANAEELLTHVRSEMERDARDKRHRFIKQEAEVTGWDGLACVSQRIVAEDRGSPLYPGEVLNFFQKGISCLRPGATGEVIHVTYSERGGPLEGSRDLIDEGDTFLKGLKRLKRGDH